MPLPHCRIYTPLVGAQVARFLAQHNHSSCFYTEPRHEIPRAAATFYEINPMAAPGHALGNPVFLEFTPMVACRGAQHAAQTHFAGVARLLFCAALMP